MFESAREKVSTSSVKLALSRLFEGEYELTVVEKCTSVEVVREGSLSVREEGEIELFFFS